MRRMREFSLVFALFASLGIALGLNGLIVPAAHAQVGISTGTIQGTVLDPNGASVAGAKVTITSKSTGAKSTQEVTSSGTYNSGPLAPGDYVVRVEANGFKALEQTMAVQVGNITPGTVTLEVGSENSVVTVEGTALAVNTEPDRPKRLSLAMRTASSWSS